MSTKISTRIKGAISTRKKLEELAVSLYGPVMIGGMRRGVLRIVRDAKKNAPVDTGQLKNSITGYVTVRDKTLTGVVGSNVKHAPWMELGTGVFAGNSAYFPPPSALAVWSRRHGVNPYAVALGIFRRGGLEPRQYLQKAFDAQRQAIMDEISEIVSKLVDNSNTGGNDE